jgi:hypothetical protein
VLNFPKLPHNERERGRTDEYRFDGSKRGFNDIDVLDVTKDALSLMRQLGVVPALA